MPLSPTDPEPPHHDLVPPSLDPVDELLPVPRLLVFGLQHLLAMYAGAVAVPLIVAGALHLPRAQLVALIDADLFTCGLATLIQTLGLGPLGVRLPLIQGCTFAAVTPMVLIGQQRGLPAIYGAVIVAGLATLLAARRASRLVRLFPPVVTGSLITVIGVSLLPVAVRWSAGGDPHAPDWAAPRHLALAFAVLAAIVLYGRFLRGFLGSIAVLLGLASGALAAIPLGLLHADGVRDAPWLGLTLPFAFGRPIFDAAAIVSMTLVMLVVMVETTGDVVAVGEIVGRPATEDDVARALRADGFATMLGGALNAFPYTAYAQNVGLVGLTRVKSRFAVAAAGGLLVGLGLLPKIAALVAAIPPPVLGGAGLVLFGTVAASGIRALARLDFDAHPEHVVVIAATLGVGLIPLCDPSFFARLPAAAQVVLQSGITLATVTAVALNALVSRKQ